MKNAFSKISFRKQNPKKTRYKELSRLLPCSHGTNSCCVIPKSATDFTIISYKRINAQQLAIYLKQNENTKKLTQLPTLQRQTHTEIKTPDPIYEIRNVTLTGCGDANADSATYETCSIYKKKNQIFQRQMFPQHPTDTSAKNSKTRGRKVMVNNCQNKQTSNLMFSYFLHMFSNSRRAKKIFSSKIEKNIFWTKNKDKFLRLSLFFEKAFTSYIIA